MRPRPTTPQFDGEKESKAPPDFNNKADTGDVDDDDDDDEEGGGKRRGDVKGGSTKLTPGKLSVGVGGVGVGVGSSGSGSQRMLTGKPNTASSGGMGIGLDVRFPPFFCFFLFLSSFLVSPL